MQEVQQEKLLTTKQVADLLGVHEHTIVEWRRHGLADLPYLKLGSRAIRYRWSDVAAWLEQNRITTGGTYEQS